MDHRVAVLPGRPHNGGPGLRLQLDARRRHRRDGARRRELAEPARERAQALVDYVNFAAACQSDARPIGGASYTIEGEPREWSDQSDGPALRILAVLQAYPQLDSATQGVARGVVRRDIDYLLGVYTGATTNLWEEKSGWSFFTRAVQLRCFREIAHNG